MKHLTLTLLILISGMNLYSQETDTKQTEKHYRQLVIGFYDLLFSKSATVKDLSNICVYGESEMEKLKIDSIKSEFIKSTKELYFTELTNNLSKNEINQIIDNASISTEGYEFGRIIELPLSKTYSVYFDLDSDIPGKIERIYFKDGLELWSFVVYNKIETIRIPAIINDAEGYTNIRQVSNKNGQITGKISENELFFYTPIANSEWYPVFTNETNVSIGFIHKSRIVNYRNFPDSIKKEVETIRGGC